MDAQGFIANFKGSTGRLPSQVELSKELGLTPQLAVKELLRAVKFDTGWVDNKEMTIHGKGVDGLQIGLYAIAALTFVLSVYFTGLWFMSMFGLFIAGAISISMVSYMVLSPQAAMRVKGLVQLPLWLTFGIALLFSMGSTVAGQYNQLTKSIDIENPAQRAVFSILKAEEQDLIEAISVDRDQQAYHQRTLESLASTAEDRMDNYQYVTTERNKVSMLASSIEDREERLNVVRDELRAEIRQGNIGVTVERDDFFGWLAILLGLGRDQVEFLIAALPAVFIDIIAALSLNLAIRQRSLNQE